MRWRGSNIYLKCKSPQDRHQLFSKQIGKLNDCHLVELEGYDKRIPIFLRLFYEKSRKKRKEKKSKQGRNNENNRFVVNQFSCH